eukprot:SAG22_NODE_1349_length_4655_cov_6.900132_8_plen_160_part_00
MRWVTEQRQLAAFLGREGFCAECTAASGATPSSSLAPPCGGTRQVQRSAVASLGERTSSFSGVTAHQCRSRGWWLQLCLASLASAAMEKLALRVAALVGRLGVGVVPLLRPLAGVVPPLVWWLGRTRVVPPTSSTFFWVPRLTRRTKCPGEARGLPTTP